MNVTRRLTVGAGVVLASAAAGAAAGLIITGLMFLTDIGHARPALAWELVRLGTQTGALFGVLVGPPTILGLLRRVPLHRLVTETFVALTYGGIVGLALSMAFRQPRPIVPLVLSGSLAGFGFAVSRLWARYRPTSNDQRFLVR